MTEDHGKYDVGPPAVTLVGVVETIKKVPSRQVTQVIVELPTECFKQAVQYFDAEVVFMTVASKEMKELPYGVHIGPVWMGMDLAEKPDRIQKVIVESGPDGVTRTPVDDEDSDYTGPVDGPVETDDEEELPFQLDDESLEAPEFDSSKTNEKVIIEPKSRLGRHCWEAIEFIKEPLFREFMVEMKGAVDDSEDACKDEFCIRCNIDSRKELDTNPESLQSAQQIYRQYNAWLKQEDS